MPTSRPLKFCESSRVQNWESYTLRTYRAKACRRAAESYTENLKRGLGLSLVPGYAYMSGEDWREALIAAKERSGLHDEQNSKLLQLATNIFMTTRHSRPLEKRKDDFRTAQSNVEICMSLYDGVMKSSLTAILEAMVISAWTAFEVLAEDLHSNVLRERPSLDTRNSWTKEEKSNSSFSSRSKIANDYRFTFRKDNGDILASLDNPAVHALAILRNVLIHSGGKIDAGFQKHRTGFEVYPSKVKIPIPQLKLIRGQSVGYRISLTGPIVRAFTDPVTPLGFDLVKSVDEWLVRNP